jgi:RNA polymerase primary sigma factor
MEFSPTDESQLDDYFREVAATPVLTPDEETQLALAIEDGNSDAREHLVRANLRLVVDKARANTGKGLSLLKLIEEGTHGLLLAVEAFDPRTGSRFAEEANRWIEQRIQNALDAAAIPNQQRDE